MSFVQVSYQVGVLITWCWTDDTQRMAICNSTAGHSGYHSHHLLVHDSRVASVMLESGTMVISYIIIASPTNTRPDHISIVEPPLSRLSSFM